VKLFSHLSEKDIFISSYKVFLARRLLMEKYESLEYEKSFITKLKVTSGRQVTDSIEGMINDLELAKDLAVRYKKERANTESIANKIEFDVKVLTTCHWPTYKSFDITVPIEIHNCMDDFSAYYSKQPQNNHRKLEWNFSMGTALLKAAISEKSQYELHVSTY
jgi:cullin 1